MGWNFEARLKDEEGISIGNIAPEHRDSIDGLRGCHGDFDNKKITER